MNSAWLQYAATSNRFRQSYIQGFLDISGNSVLRGGSLSIKNGGIYLNQGDISMNGNITTVGSLSSGSMTVDGNTLIKNSVQIDNDASIMSSLGVGKAANESYPLDVSGIARFSSSINVNGSATLASIGNVVGSSRFTGNVGIGTSAPTSDYILLVNGKTRTTDAARFDTSATIGASIDPTTKATLYVKDSLLTDASNSVILDVPNTLYTSIDSANSGQVNSLEVDTQNRVIKPYRKYEGDLVPESTDGWDLGATGAYSFNRVYGRTIEVSSGVGIGKDSSASYALDVSGATRLSGGLTVSGATSLSSITDVTGTSKFSGRVGFGKVAATTNAVDISGNVQISGNTIFDRSIVIGQNTPSTAALRVNVPYNSDIANSVELEVPNVLYKSTSSANPSQTNFLEIDTKTRNIKPYAMEGNTMLNSASTGWNLGGPGANRFNKIYGRDLEISTNTIKIEDSSGNQISMSFDATTGAVNYTVTTISGEVFVIKGVQTQKIGSGNGTIDPALFEFTGLSFGDTFITDGSYNLASTFTYNLGTTTYTGNGTYFSNSVNPQSLASFTTGQNLSTLLLNIPNKSSVVIKVGPVDGRTTHLEGIDTAGSLISLSNKIISVNKTGSVVKWTLWNSENYQNVSGNYLHYIELKNINMANGSYFVSKTTGTIAYNIVDSQYLTSEDLSAVNGDMYLYVNRGPGKNWTKIPVSLPKTGSIQTQHLADSAVSNTKLANNSITGDKIASGSISGLSITDNSITSDKIADSNVSTVKITDGAITGAKLANGAINSANLIANGIITGDKLVAGTIGASLLDASAVVTNNLAAGAVTMAKLADSAVTTAKIVDGAVTASKMSTDSIGTTNIISGAVTGAKIATSTITGDKIADGTITADKLAAGVITGSLLDASSVTMDKIASVAISTDKLASLAVTSAKLAADAVTTTKLVDLAVTDAKLAALSVIESKIGAGAVTASKLAANAVTVDKIADGSVSSGKLADLAVVAAKINPSAVTADKLAISSVTTTKLADYAVTSIKIANSAIDANQINDLAVSTSKLAAGAVTTAKIGSAQVVASTIATDAITTDKILAGAVTTAKIAAGAITTSLLDVSAVTTAKIATGAVSTAKIASGAITTASIATGAITTSLLDASAVTTAKIATGAVSTANIAAGAVVTASIATGAIQTALLDASAVTTSKIATGAVTADKITDGSITTGKITNSAIVTSKIAELAVTTAKIADGSITAAKLASDFTLPSSAGGGSTIDSTTNVLARTYSTALKSSGTSKILLNQLYPSSQSSFTIFSEGLSWSVSKISGDGKVVIVYTNSSKLAVFRLNSSGLFVFSTFINNYDNTIPPIVQDISYDGNTIIYINKPGNTSTQYFFGVLKYTTSNSTWTNSFVPTIGTYGLRAIKFSGDGTKIVLSYSVGDSLWAYTNTNQQYGILIYDSTTYRLLKNINTTSLGGIIVIQNENIDMLTPIGVSNTGSRIIYGAPGHASKIGKVIVYETTFNNTSFTYTAVASSPAPSYAPAGYLPIPLENLPSRFKLRIANGSYLGMNGNNTLRVANIAVLPVIQHCVFSADRPDNLYSAVGTNTYRLYQSSWLNTGSGNRKNTPVYMDSGATSVVSFTESPDTTYKYAWQLFLKTGTTTNEVVLWTPSSTGGSGKFITTNVGGTASNAEFSLGTGTPIVFYLEPESLSDLNPTTIIYEVVGTATTGVNSNLGGSVAISSNGNTIAFVYGDMYTFTNTNLIKIYNYVSANNWPLQKTIAQNNIIGGPDYVFGFGIGIKFNNAGNLLVINAGRTEYLADAFITLFSLVNGEWVFSDYYNRSNIVPYAGLGTSLSITADGSVGLIADPNSGATYNNLYIFKFLLNDSAALSTNSDYLTTNIRADITGYVNINGSNSMSTFYMPLITASDAYLTTSTTGLAETFLSNSKTINSVSIRNNVNPQFIGIAAGLSIYNKQTGSYWAQIGQHQLGFGVSADSTKMVWLDSSYRWVYFMKRSSDGTWTNANVIDYNNIENSGSEFRGGSYENKFLPIMSGDGNTAAVFGGANIGGDVYGQNYSYFRYNKINNSWSKTSNISMLSNTGYPRKAKFSYDGSRILIITNANSMFHLSNSNPSINASIRILKTGDKFPLFSVDVGAEFGIDIDDDVQSFYSLQYSPFYEGPDITRNRFGCSDDLSRVIISAAKNSTTSGRAIVLDINLASGKYTKIFDLTLTGQKYGLSCEMSGDGQVIAISNGNPFSSSTSIMIYKYDSTLTTSNKYALAQTIAQSGSGLASTTGFGTNMKFNSYGGDTLMVNAVRGSAVYRAADSSRISWTLLHTITGGIHNHFGANIGISGDGNSYFIQEANAFANNNGCVWLYARTETDFNTNNGYITGNLITGGSITSTGISVTGNIIATGTVTSSSDDRLKENEVLVENATETLMKLRPEIYMKKPTFDSTDSTKWQKETGVVAQEVWYSTPELRHLVSLGYDISGNYEYSEIDNESVEEEQQQQYNSQSTDYFLSMDVSGNYYITYFSDLSDGPEPPKRTQITDASYNEFQQLAIPKIIEPKQIKIKPVFKPKYLPVDPSKIKDYTPTPDIQVDPDYTALGWGDTPASVNYIGLIPYLIKSIQELKAESDSQKERIRVLENR